MNHNPTRARFVTDGGLETDLMFHHGVDLPGFAAYPLVRTSPGRDLLHRYYADYAAVARAVGAGLLLETPTWRANPDWGARLGDDAAALDAANREAAAYVCGLRSELAGDIDDVRVVGMVGPRGDGYVPGERIDPEEARWYHRAQIASLAAGGVDLVTAYTLTGVEEAQGIVRAAHDVDIPVAISFTVETDGRLPDGSTLREAVSRLDDVASPEYIGVNCAHPEHMTGAFDGGAWQDRVWELRPNASRQSHSELDAATELDEGDPVELSRVTATLVEGLANLQILGGCCGTDARHVAALWGAVTAEAPLLP